MTKSRTLRGKSWAPPTRRAFVGMLGAAIAAIAVRERLVTEDDRPAEPERTPWAGKTRWIGHC